MIRNVGILTLNDLATSLQNKSLYLALFIPLFVFVTLHLIDDDETYVQKINIGVLEQGQYPPALIPGLQSAGSVFEVSWLPDESAGKRWLRDRRGDGILVPRGTTGEDCNLIVLARASLQTAAIVENLAGLQRALEGRNRDWIAQIQPLQDKGMQAQMLPTWILMLVLLAGFIILPAQVAEEKEKRRLPGLLQTPIHEMEWLIAKVCFGTTLIVMAAIFLQLLTGLDFDLRGGLNYLAVLIVGGVCFSAFGILIGFLCRTQASARTLGVIFYLPNLLPSALADFSKSLNSVAPLLPSFQFYRPIKSILLEGDGLSDFPLELLVLVALGLVSLYLSHRLMKKRWLM